MRPVLAIALALTLGLAGCGAAEDVRREVREGVEAVREKGRERGYETGDPSPVRCLHAGLTRKNRPPALVSCEHATHPGACREIYGRMLVRTHMTFAMAALAALVLTGAAPAAVTAPQARLDLTEVTQPPSTASNGERIVMKARMRNDSRVNSGRGILTMRIFGGPTATDVSRRILRTGTGVMLPRTFKRYRVRFTIPQEFEPGRYRVRTCLRSRGHRGQECRVSRVVRVTAAG